jgi:ADP-heptose:LPS heptosyltransferase
MVKSFKNSLSYLLFMASKILVVLLHGLGDSLMAAPALKALKKKHPGATLMVMTLRAMVYQSLWKYNEDVDGVVFSSLRSNPRYGHPFFWLRNYWKIRRDIRRAVRREGYDKVFFVKMFLMPAKVYSLFPLKKYRMHKVYHVARELGVVVDDPQYTFDYGSEGKTWLNTYLRKHSLSPKKLVGLHFTGSSPNKCMSFDDGQAIVSMLKEKGYQVVLFHSPGSYRDEQVHYPSDDVHTYISEDLLHTGALVDACQFLICVDSGVSHFAGALHKKVFVMYFKKIWSQNSLVLGKTVVPHVYRDKEHLLDSVKTFIS